MKPAARAKKIKLLLMDVDGVLTDGKLFYFQTREGVVEETKGFDSKDGIALQLAHEAGIQTGFISGRRSAGVVERAKILKVTFVYQEIWRKTPAYEEILKKTGLKDDQVAYVGDDLPDLPIFGRVGLAAAPADSAPELLKAAHLVTKKPGGRGAVREVVELILKSQGLWETALKKRGVY
jgi:3-deoxy-D-manno-octulosonate 8-phosphate phosphatase (KDO 8-P phosphatase)